VQICMQIHWRQRVADLIVVELVSVSTAQLPVKSKTKGSKGKSHPVTRYGGATSARSARGKRRTDSRAEMVESIGRREEKLAAKLVAAVEKGDDADVVRLCETYGLKREELGRLTGFSLRALAEWSAGKLPSEPARRRLHEIRRLLDALAEVVKVEAIPKWLGRRNPSFENMTPLQVIELGEVDRLWQMVYAMGDGNAS